MGRVGVEGAPKFSANRDMTAGRGGEGINRGAVLLLPLQQVMLEARANRAREELLVVWVGEMTRARKERSHLSHIFPQSLFSPILSLNTLDTRNNEAISSRLERRADTTLQ